METAQEFDYSQLTGLGKVVYEENKAIFDRAEMLAVKGLDVSNQLLIMQQNLLKLDTGDIDQENFDFAMTQFEAQVFHQSLSPSKALACYNFQDVTFDHFH